MKKAQANYKIAEVWVIVNRDLKEKYENRKAQFKSQGKDVSEVFGFHGSARNNLMGIAKTNFLPPDKLPKASEPEPKGKGRGKGKSKAKPKPKKGEPKITILDDGYAPYAPFYLVTHSFSVSYYGKGIYCSVYSDYAMWYSEDKGSGKRHGFLCNGRKLTSWASHLDQILLAKVRILPHLTE